MYSMSLMGSKTVATVLTLFYRSSKETLRTQAGLKLLHQIAPRNLTIRTNVSLYYVPEVI